MAQPRPICCEISAVGGGDLPADLRLGDIESLLLPLCAAQRLVAIELQHSPDMQSIPGAVVEFATEADAAACAGQRELKGMAVELTVRHNTPFKRTRDGDDGSEYVRSAAMHSTAESDAARSSSRAAAFMVPQDRVGSLPDGNFREIAFFGRPFSRLDRAFLTSSFSRAMSFSWTTFS